MLFIPQYLGEIKNRKIEPEMLELARHILKTKAGKFDPAKFDDRYEKALTEMVQAKISGKKIVPLRPPKITKTNDLLEALRLSAGGAIEAAVPKRQSSSKSKPGTNRKKASAAKKAPTSEGRAAPHRKAS